MPGVKTQASFEYMLELQLYLLLLLLCPLDEGGGVGHLLAVLLLAPGLGLVLLGCQLLVVVLLPVVGQVPSLSGGVVLHPAGVFLPVVLALQGDLLPGCPGVALLVLVPQL